MNEWIHLDNHTVDQREIRRISWFNVKGEPEKWAARVFLREVNNDGTAVFLDVTEQREVKALADYYMKELDWADYE